MIELEKEIVEYLLSLDQQIKIIKRLRKLMPDDPQIQECEIRIQKKIQLYESFLTTPVKRKKKINIRRTFNNVVYMVRFVYWFKHLLKRKKR
jgi:hypothetical protein